MKLKFYTMFTKPASAIIKTIAPNTPAEKHVTNCCVMRVCFPFNPYAFIVADYGFAVQDALRLELLFACVAPLELREDCSFLTSVAHMEIFILSQL